MELSAILNWRKCTQMNFGLFYKGQCCAHLVEKLCEHSELTPNLMEYYTVFYRTYRSWGIQSNSTTHIIVDIVFIYST